MEARPNHNKHLMPNLLFPSHVLQNSNPILQLKYIYLPPGMLRVINFNKKIEIIITQVQPDGLQDI
jgi:hypothetical protein